MLWARAASIIFFTLGTIAAQRGRWPQLFFMKSSTSSAVVFGSTVTVLSSGFGGIFTLSQSLMMSPRAGAMSDAAMNAATRIAECFMAVLPHLLFAGRHSERGRMKRQDGQDAGRIFPSPLVGEGAEPR